MMPPAIEVAGVMQVYGGQYLRLHGDRMPAAHRKAIADIVACRTPVMGGTSWHCPDCDQWQYSYHSCGNRNCNKCGNDRAQQWLEQTGKRLLPVDHFMVTFTLPGELRQRARSHQRLFYGLLMQCAAASLQTLGWDSRFVGGKLAMMGVLHTWSRDLNYHPHVHMIVAGGGLWPDEGLWLEARRDFLVPVKALSVIFAAKFRDGLKKQAPDLHAAIDPSVWACPWVVHSQPVGKGQPALKYLAQYIFRPAISNRRLVSMTGGKVTFRWQHAQTNQWKTTTLDPIEFIRRYLQHVLPRGFVKVRYYGLYAHRHRELLVRLHHQLLPVTMLQGESDPDKQQSSQESEQPIATAFPGCRCCGKPMRMVEHIPRGGSWPHAPPAGFANPSGCRNHDLSIHHNVPVTMQ
jgi:hypothetical protein